MKRLKDVIAAVSPVAVKLEFVPILLGALFKELGTPMVGGCTLFLHVIVISGVTTGSQALRGQSSICTFDYQVVFSSIYLGWTLYFSKLP